jgi:Na+-driven multidrug efflux pump
VARSEGAYRRDLAGRFCSSALLFNATLSTVLSVIAWFNLRSLLQLLGASGVTLDYATSYASIVLPSMPIVMLGMSMAAGVRAVGDARRSMWATVTGSLVNGALDPLFIFTFGWGLEGAALASVVARVVLLAVAWHALHRIHDLPRWVTLREFVEDLRPIMTIAGPAMLTNLATPIGGSFVLRTMSQFGDSAVAGAAILPCPARWARLSGRMPAPGSITGCVRPWPAQCCSTWSISPWSGCCYGIARS